MIRGLVSGVIAILLSGFGVFLATPHPVQACSCVDLTPQEKVELASTVFHGRVTAIDLFIPTARANPWFDNAVQFQVETVWKGAVVESIVIVVERSTEACGFAFDLGEEYLVYADGPPFYTTGWCAGTKLFDGDVAHLGAGWTPRPGIDEQALAYDQRYSDAAAAESEPAPPESVEPEPSPPAEAPTVTIEPEPPPAASQDAGETSWIWIAVGIGAAAIGVAVAIAAAWRRRGKSSG